MSVGLRLEVMMALLVAGSAGAFIGFLWAGMIAVRVERKLREQLGKEDPDPDGVRWALSHPTTALLLFLWPVLSFMALSGLVVHLLLVRR